MAATVYYTIIIGSAITDPNAIIPLTGHSAAGLSLLAKPSITLHGRSRSTSVLEISQVITQVPKQALKDCDGYFKNTLGALVDQNAVAVLDETGTPLSADAVRSL